MKNIVIGIDISSKTLDLCVQKKNRIDYFVIENRIKTIKTFFNKYKKDEVVVAMENTGRYNWNLYEVLECFNFKIYVIPPLHLKKSLGLTRGKNDKIDALRICNFIVKNLEETIQWQPTPLPIRRLKTLITERSSRIKMKKRLLAQQHDYKLIKTIGLDKELTKLNKQLIKKLDDQISLLEKRIDETIKTDTELDYQSKLIQSVPGAGKVLTWMILAKTEGFRTIKDPRKLACYAGVVPFDYQSGSSLKYKPKVSIFADKQLKTILHLAAMSAIRLDNDLRIYYLRKVEEGKNKMSVLNAVRNKIVHRIFAVVKNQSLYKNNLVLS